MEVGKKEKQENKKIKILVSLIIIVILVVTVTMIFLKRSNEEELNTSLKEMGKNFYENFYYEQIGSSSNERNALLSKFTTIGIKVDLENLGRYNDGEFSKEIKEFKNNKTGKNCNKTKTKVIIYPKTPYGKTDYKIETELGCGFKK